MDFDDSWREPTEAQLAALKHVYICLGEKGIPEHPLTLHQQVMLDVNQRAYAADADIFDFPLSPFELAEMMLTAAYSLWYSQAKLWAEGKTPEHRLLPEQSSLLFKLAGASVARIVEYGYQDGQWWSIEKLWPDPAVRATIVCALIEVVRLVDAVNAPRDGWDLIKRAMADDFGIRISPGFSHLPGLLVPRLNVRQITRLLGEDSGMPIALAEVQAIFDPEFRKKLNRTKRDIRADISATYKPVKCIHPKCGNLVAPPGIKPCEGHYKNYRGTGACQKGHNAYFCTKCQAPHSFASKIGQQHYEKHYGKNWDGTDMTGQPWKRW